MGTTKIGSECFEHSSGFCALNPERTYSIVLGRFTDFGKAAYDP